MSENSVLQKNFSYRYLKDSEIKEPHFFAAAIFARDTSIEFLRYDLLNFFKSACTRC